MNVSVPLERVQAITFERPRACWRDGQPSDSKLAQDNEGGPWLVGGWQKDEGGQDDKDDGTIWRGCLWLRAAVS
eukprot:8348468-Alexandrium_andersonii.AAC.1